MDKLKYFEYFGLYSASFNHRYNKDFKMYQFNMNVYSERLEKEFLIECRFIVSNNKILDLKFYKIINGSYSVVSRHRYDKLYDQELKQFFYNGFKFDLRQVDDILDDVVNNVYAPYDSNVITISTEKYQFIEIDGTDIIYDCIDELDDDCAEYYVFEVVQTITNRIYVSHNDTMDIQNEIDVPLDIEILNENSYGVCIALNKYIIPPCDIDKINDVIEKKCI